MQEKAAFEEYLILKGYSKKTAQSMARMSAYFVAWLEGENIDVLGVSYNDVLAYVQHCKQRGNKQRTIQRAVAYSKSYYTYLIEMGITTHNPCLNVSIQGVQRRTLYQCFSEEQLGELYESYNKKPLPSRDKENAQLRHTRNKIILGLLIFQGLRSEELAALRVEDIKMRESKLKIAGSKRSEGRTMALQGHQLYDLMDYVNETRKIILSKCKNQTPNDALFISLEGGTSFSNTLTYLLKEIKQINKNIKNIKQIRTSVITNWLKVYNLRKVQYLAGHRFVSSTEAYKINNLEGLKEDIKRFHPNF